LKRLALIIATKDRPKEIRRLFDNIQNQTAQPYQIIVVDSGGERVDGIVREYPRLNLNYLHTTPPSAARQRNEGLKAAKDSSELIGFIDDDIIFQELALEKMASFWENAPIEIGGAGFNLINHPPLFARAFKSLRLTERLGFYSSRRGAVLRSGFQTMIGTVDKNTEVDWLPSTAVVWRKNIFERFKFDEWYEGYSYLEDLDFSYPIRKKYKLYIVADAKYHHLPAVGGRGSDFQFGIKEIKNRLHFVQKNPDLSWSKCYQTLILRTILNMVTIFLSRRMSYVKRTIGNLVGFLN
jgi:glycosyltransferase involved in cell wall biosynthesis